MHLALGDAQPRQPAGVAQPLVNGQQCGFGLVAQQLGVRQCAGGDHAHHFALHRAFAGDFTHLLANGDRLAVPDELGQITFDRVKRHASHRDRQPPGLAATREGDVQQRGRFFGVSKKQLVKITHAVEDQRIGKFGLDAQILLHHGGVLLVFVGHPGKSINIKRLSSNALSAG